MYKRAWQATVHGVTKSDMIKRQILCIYMCVYTSTKHPGMRVIAVSRLHIFNFSKYSLLNPCLSIVYWQHLHYFPMVFTPCLYFPCLRYFFKEPFKSSVNVEPSGFQLSPHSWNGPTFSFSTLLPLNKGKKRKRKKQTCFQKHTLFPLASLAVIKLFCLFLSFFLSPTLMFFLKTLT